MKVHCVLFSKKRESTAYFLFGSPIVRTYDYYWVRWETYPLLTPYEMKNCLSDSDEQLFVYLKDNVNLASMISTWFYGVLCIIPKCFFCGSLYSRDGRGSFFIHGAGQGGARPKSTGRRGARAGSILRFGWLGSFATAKEILIRIVLLKWSEGNPSPQCRTSIPVIFNA